MSSSSSSISVEESIKKPDQAITKPDQAITKPLQKKSPAARRNTNIGIALFMLDGILLAGAGAVYVMKPSCVNDNDDSTRNEFFPGMEQEGSLFEDHMSPEFNLFKPASSFGSYGGYTPSSSSGSSPYSGYYTPSSSSGSSTYSSYYNPSSSSGSSPYSSYNFSSGSYSPSSSYGSPYGSYGNTTDYYNPPPVSVPSVVSGSYYGTGLYPPYSPTPTSGFTYGTPSSSDSPSPSSYPYPYPSPVSPSSYPYPSPWPSPYPSPVSPSSYPYPSPWPSPYPSPVSPSSYPYPSPWPSPYPSPVSPSSYPSPSPWPSPYPSPVSPSSYPSPSPWPSPYPSPVSPSSYPSPSGTPAGTEADVSLIPHDRFSDPNFECGVPVIKPNLKTGRIAGGKEAVPHSWPWIVHFGYTGYFGSYFYVCGGTIVTPRHVISAWHCYQGEDHEYAVRVGKHDSIIHGEQKKIHKIREHPLAGHGDYNYLHYDLILGTLEEELQLTDNVRPACLPPQDTTVASGTTCWAYGWGKNDFSNYRGQLLQVPQKIGNEKECIEEHFSDSPESAPYLTKELAICAGSETGDTCKGDSGGSLTCNEGGKWVLYGAASWGYFGCGGGKYGVYAAVSFSMSWFCCFMNDLPICADIACDVENFYSPEK